jgi:Reverse transcriptase (RNA-dependent DNA polymerase)
MSKLTQDLEYVKTYLDDLLILTNSSFADHLTKLEMVLARLSTAGMRVNASKSKFFAEQIVYLGLLDYLKRYTSQSKNVSQFGQSPSPSSTWMLLHLVCTGQEHLWHLAYMLPGTTHRQMISFVEGHVSSRISYRQMIESGHILPKLGDPNLIPVELFQMIVLDR